MASGVPRERPRRGAGSALVIVDEWTTAPRARRSQRHRDIGRFHPRNATETRAAGRSLSAPDYVGSRGGTVSSSQFFPTDHSRIHNADAGWASSSGIDFTTRQFIPGPQCIATARTP
jgi:hypothetical protein